MPFAIRLAWVAVLRVAHSRAAEENVPAGEIDVAGSTLEVRP
jgi:hypothetical protein